MYAVILLPPSTGTDHRSNALREVVCISINSGGSGFPAIVISPIFKYFHLIQATSYINNTNRNNASNAGKK